MKADSIFKHHFIRITLLQTWLKYGKERSEEKPLWIAPEEVIYNKVGKTKERVDTYQDLIKLDSNQITLKTEEELGGKYNWWLYLSIKDLFNENKRKYGFRYQKTKLEIILLGDDNKLISKIYKTLLERHKIDEVVKEQMIKWAININTDMFMDQW